MTSAAEVDSAEDLGEIGTETHRTITHFFESWSTLDVNRIAEFVSDDIVYQFIDGMPTINGKTAFIRFVTEYLRKQQKVEWIFRDFQVIGNLAINQRVYRYESESGTPDANFKVVGLFILKDGRIAEWRDYRLPGDNEGRTK